MSQAAVIFLDLQLLIKDTSLGLDSICDRCLKLDRSTLVSLLSKREYITEEKANRTINQIKFARSSFSQFDRDTLVAVLSSREDISEADAKLSINSIEGARNSVSPRVERIQQETQKRLEAIRQQTIKPA